MYLQNYLAKTLGNKAANSSDQKKDSGPGQA